METITLILPLQAKTVYNPSYSSGVTAGTIAEATSGVTGGVMIEEDRATDSAKIA